MTWEDSNFKGNECGRHSSVKQNGETMCQEKYMSMISVINWLYPLSELQKRNWRSINCSVVQLSTMLGMQKGIHCWVIAITRHKWKIIIPRRKTMNLSKGFVQQELGNKDWGYLEFPHSQSASSAKINICNDKALALLGTGRKHLTMREQKKIQENLILPIFSDYNSHESTNHQLGMRQVPAPAICKCRRLGEEKFELLICWDKKRRPCSWCSLEHN